MRATRGPPAPVGAPRNLLCPRVESYARHLGAPEFALSSSGDLCVPLGRPGICSVLEWKVMRAAQGPPAPVWAPRNLLCPRVATYARHPGPTGARLGAPEFALSSSGDLCAPLGRPGICSVLEWRLMRATRGPPAPVWPSRNLLCPRVESYARHLGAPEFALSSSGDLCVPLGRPEICSVLEWKVMRAAQGPPAPVLAPRNLLCPRVESYARHTGPAGARLGAPELALSSSGDLCAPPGAHRRPFGRPGICSVLEWRLMRATRGPPAPVWAPRNLLCPRVATYARHPGPTGVRLGTPGFALSSSGELCAPLGRPGICSVLEWRLMRATQDPPAPVRAPRNLLCPRVESYARDPGPVWAPRNLLCHRVATYARHTGPTGARLGAPEFALSSSGDLCAPPGAHRRPFGRPGIRSALEWRLMRATWVHRNLLCPRVATYARHTGPNGARSGAPEFALSSSGELCAPLGRPGICSVLEWKVMRATRGPPAPVWAPPGIALSSSGNLCTPPGAHRRPFGRPGICSVLEWRFMRATRGPPAS
eukprot:gene57571-biopygen2045